MQHLADNNDFAVDFAHPIDEKLADFLQSQASVDCLARGGYVSYIPSVIIVTNDSGLKVTPASVSTPLPESPVCFLLLGYSMTPS